MQKPSLPKGTRDFGPEQMARRNHIFDKIKTTFQKYGFQPLETPSMENLSVLTGKYGDEGDQLLFKILNSGEFLKKTSVSDYESGEKVVLPKIAEKGLRYDLTVPFARYVVMNRHSVNLPFKRYQIQPVWRADRPQKGRYREFYQCDADVVGTDSLICEAEIIMMMTEVFSKLGLDSYEIKINNRKLLSALAELTGTKEKESDLLVAIDKLDKIGMEKVLEELKSKGFSDDSLEKILPVLQLSGSNDDKILTLEKLFESSESGKRGVEELKEIFEILRITNTPSDKVVLDLTLARGLSYYTGAIFEVKPLNVKMGSISGGGRYDDLTGVFGMPDLSGVGFSFGVDRIYDVMEELDLFPDEGLKTIDVMVAHFDQESLKYGLGVLAQLRRNGISAEIYPDLAKPKKQFSYANNKNIPNVIVIGSEEIKTGLLSLKNMKSGDQESLSIEQIIDRIK
ncbi:histidine--tRNA ligase [Flammeovirgaceae bacterium KN852]|uniref:Histidine--tRNA ligase n=2 Tax=Marinigracilibium pacificum TaxID=2729599 RepID=A0A848J3V4_9BACT|nr:histidine--tRNA ligase [Marinigracilibium pacificum]NMM49164.1 histidine--tRNA ligase [Marinigracilibium pacificum]